jgi:hypothetical protein
MQRNRRIGTSVSGLAGFADSRSLPLLREWLDTGYGEVQRWDRIYSEPGRASGSRSRPRL